MTMANTEPTDRSPAGIAKAAADAAAAARPKTPVNRDEAAEANAAQTKAHPHQEVGPLATGSGGRQ